MSDTPSSPELTYWLDDGGDWHQHATLDEAKAAGTVSIDDCRNDSDDGEWPSWVDDIYVVQQPKTAGHPAEDPDPERMVVMRSTSRPVTVQGADYWEYDMMPVEPRPLR